MKESPNQDARERLEHFDEIVDWCRSNGFTDFDFEGLEQRVLELAKTVGSSDAEAAPAAPEGEAKTPSSKLIYFRKSSRRRDS